MIVITVRSGFLLLLLLSRVVVVIVAVSVRSIFNDAQFFISFRGFLSGCGVIR